MAYFVSRNAACKETLRDSTATLDAAFHMAAKLSRKEFGEVFIVWENPARYKEAPKVRAFAHAGVARWAKSCDVPVGHWGSHAGCTKCGGLGVVESLTS